MTTPDDLIRRFCQLQAKVMGEVFGYMSANDCFCGERRDWVDSGDRAGGRRGHTHEGGCLTNRGCLTSDLHLWHAIPQLPSVRPARTGGAARNGVDAMAEKLCINCEALPIRKRLRCGPCSSWLYRHGTDRPMEQCAAHGLRVLEDYLAERAG